IINAGATAKADAKEFNPIMVAPFASENLGVSASKLGNSPVITYINDYGGRPELNFRCQASSCQVVPETK
ncbi:MAG: molecular chaperone, partial [Providencia sp.]